MCVQFLIHVQMQIIDSFWGVFTFRECICWKHKPEERSEFIHYHPNVTNWSKAGLMMGQNANVGELSLLGAAGLIYEFACVLQPNTAQISRHFPRDVAAAKAHQGGSSSAGLCMYT